MLHAVPGPVARMNKLVALTTLSSIALLMVCASLDRSVCTKSDVCYDTEEPGCYPTSTPDRYKIRLGHTKLKSFSSSSRKMFKLEHQFIEY